MKNKKFIFPFLMFAIVGLGLYAISPVYAEDENTYLYVDEFGNLLVEVADTSSEAIVDAENRALHSGVMLIDSNPDLVDTYADNEETTYAYVDYNGNLRIEVAENPTEALIESEGRAQNSGVIIYDEL